MKPSDPLLVADVTLSCVMYPAGKVDVSQHLAILSASPVQMLVYCVVKHSSPPDLKSSSNVSLPFAWFTGPATDPSFYGKLIRVRYKVLNQLVYIGKKVCIP